MQFRRVTLSSKPGLTPSSSSSSLFWTASKHSQALACRLRWKQKDWWPLFYFYFYFLNTTKPPVSSWKRRNKTSMDFGCLGPWWRSQTAATQPPNKISNLKMALNFTRWSFKKPPKNKGWTFHLLQCEGRRLLSLVKVSKTRRPSMKRHPRLNPIAIPRRWPFFSSRNRKWCKT